MKTLIIIITLMISTLIGNAQNFIDTTKVWTVSKRVVTGASYGYPTTVQFRFGGDTILEGVTYAKMNVNEGAAQWKFHSLWREDEQRNVYYKRGHSSESVYYNFSFAKGDTSSFIGLEIVVDSTAIKPFGSKEKKHIYASYLDVPGHVITWIEGVGSLYGPDVSDHYFLVGGLSTLICFEENNEHVYLNPMYTACNAQSGTSVFEIENKNRFEIRYSVNGDIKFINPTGCNGTLSFMTVDGRTVKRYNIASNEGIIHFPYTGLFLYRFVSEKNQVQTGRVLAK